MDFKGVIITVFACVSACSAGAATLTYNSSLANPGFYAGTGNANANFTVATNNGVELGLSATARYLGPIDPGSGNVYEASAGTTDGIANWNFEFSVNTQFEGGFAVLGDYNYSLLVQDVTTSTSATLFDPVRLIPDNSFWNGAENVDASGVIASSALATYYGAQNSENLSFGFPGFNPYALDLYQITLSVLDKANGDVLNSVTIQTQVTPEPGTFVIGSLGLAFAGLVFKRRRSSCSI